MKDIKFLYLLTVFTLGCVALIRANSFPVATVAQELSGEDRLSAIQFLNETLAKLGDSVESSYNVGFVTSVKSQIVSGLEYSYKAELKDGITTKPCNLTIWHQTWLKVGSIALTMKCLGEQEIETIF